MTIKTEMGSEIFKEDPKIPRKKFSTVKDMKLDKNIPFA